MKISYEGKMLETLKMPPRSEVEQALLKALFKHNGTIKEFSLNEDIVDELATDFSLNEAQRTAFLESLYRKENRIKKSYLWPRLLYRAAAALEKRKFVSNPTSTFHLTNKKEWMLTENGFDAALNILHIPLSKKEHLPTKSYEVQKIVKEITELKAPENYDPFDKEKKIVKVTRESALRSRGFRQAVIEEYDFKCSFCGMKLSTPDSLLWEVEAAHIVPHSSKGKDDIWNGLALCHLHHWAFDVGWFTLQNDFSIQVSSKINSLPTDFAKLGDYNFLKVFANDTLKMNLPKRKQFYPHENAITWHRQNRFHQ